MATVSIFHQLGRRLTEYLLGLFFIFLPMLVLLVKSVFRGRQVWTVQPRPNPPMCLSDPEYGTHRYIKINNIKIHYVEAGNSSNPLVVFIHGFPEFWYSWRHQIKALKNNFWTVALDMRGYGESDKPSGVKSYDDTLLVDDIKCLVQALGRKSCIVIAHDWGGMVAYLLAKRYPEVVEKLILLNSPHPVCWFQVQKSSWKQFLKSWYVFAFQLPFLPEVLMRSEDLALFDKVYRENLKDKSVICDHDIEAYKYTFPSLGDWRGPINYYRSFLKKSKEIEMEMTRKIDVPALIIWGCNDLYLEIELAKLSCQFFVTCTVSYVKNGGHFVQQDSAPVVNNYIKSFLKGEDVISEPAE